MLYTGDFVLRYYVRFSQIRSQLPSLGGAGQGPGPKAIHMEVGRGRG